VHCSSVGVASMSASRLITKPRDVLLHVHTRERPRYDWCHRVCNAQQVA